MAEREAVMGMDVNEAGKMQKIAENFRSVSVFQYNKDIELEVISRTDVKSVDVIESLIMQEKIQISDMYLLEAVAFYGHADLQTVMTRLKYLKQIYPHKFILTNPDSVSRRMQYLAKYGLIWRRKYSRGTDANIHIYTSTYRGFKLYCDKLEKGFHYDGAYLAQNVTKVFRNVHVGEVACIFFNKIQNADAVVEEWRHNDYFIKVDKERFYPTGYIRCRHGEDTWNFIFEAMHYNVDERIETAAERTAKIKEKLEELILIKDSFSARYENTAFVFCVEEIKGVKKLWQMLSEYSGDFNGNVYITSERVLKQTGGNFEMSVIKPIIDGDAYRLKAADKEKEWFF